MKKKVLFLTTSLLLLTACREEVFTDQSLNEVSDNIELHEEIDGYTELDHAIYLKDSIANNSESLPPSYSIIDTDAESIANDIANYYAISYYVEEVVVDNHHQSYITFDQAGGNGIIMVDEDNNNISLDLSFGEGGTISTLLTGTELTYPNYDLDFMSKADLEDEISGLLESFGGFTEFKYTFYSLSESDMAALIEETEEISQTLGKPMPFVEAQELYYVFVTPVIEGHEIFAYDILGRQEDWTLFNPGTEIRLIYTENGLQNIFLSSFFIPEDKISDAPQQAEYDREAIIEQTANQFRDRLDSAPVLIESVDYIYLTNLMNQESRERYYQPYWRVIVNHEDGTLLETLYFNPLTGSEYQ